MSRSLPPRGRLPASLDAKEGYLSRNVTWRRIPNFQKKSRHPGQQVRGSRTNCYATQCRGLPWNCPPLPCPSSCHNNSNLTVSGDMANWVLFNMQHDLFPGGRRRLTTSNPSSSKMIAEVLSRFNTCLTSSCHHNM